MKEFKGTPGPWVYAANSAFFDVGQDHREEQPSTVMDVYPSVCIGVPFDQEDDARLIAASYDLLIEHHEWAKEIGKVYMAVIQGDMYEAKAILEDMANISFATGEPVAVSPAIAKALGEDHE